MCILESREKEEEDSELGGPRVAGKGDVEYGDVAMCGMRGGQEYGALSSCS